MTRQAWVPLHGCQRVRRCSPRLHRESVARRNRRFSFWGWLIFFSGGLKPRQMIWEGLFDAINISCMYIDIYGWTFLWWLNFISDGTSRYLFLWAGKVVFSVSQFSWIFLCQVAVIRFRKKWFLGRSFLAEFGDWSPSSFICSLISGSVQVVKRKSVAQYIYVDIDVYRWK